MKLKDLLDITDVNRVIITSPKGLWFRANIERISHFYNRQVLKVAIYDTYGLDDRTYESFPPLLITIKDSEE